MIDPDSDEAKEKIALRPEKFQLRVVASAALHNNSFWVASAILVACVGFCLGLLVRDFMCFARSGALVVAIGLFLLSRASIVGVDIKTHVISDETGKSYLDPEHWKIIGKEMPDWVTEDLQSRRAVGVFGPWVSFAGTLIWGFGDLLNQLIK